MSFADKRSALFFGVIITILTLCVFFLSIKSLIVCVGVGVASGIASYLLTQSRVKKIVRDGQIEIENGSFKALIAILLGSFISGRFVPDYLGVVLAFLLTFKVGMLVLGILATIHPPTHDLRTRK